MTAAEFADLVKARAVSRNRFQARCPAHGDRSPSLSIAEGRDGRVLIHCFAGCTVDDILSALKLARRDLFQGPPPSPGQLAALEAARKLRAQQKRMVREAEAQAWNKVRRWEAVVSALGAKLARRLDDAPDTESLRRTFHSACEQLHKAETDAVSASEMRAAA
jgi:hypothetical protein